MDTPEKALCDLFASQPRLRSRSEVRELLDLMRLDQDFFENRDQALLEKISDSYGRAGVRQLTTVLKAHHV